MRAGAHLPPPTGPQTVITTHDYTRLPTPPIDDSDTPEPEVSFYDTDNNLLVLGERYIYTASINNVLDTYIGTYYDRVPHLIMFNNILQYPSGDPVSVQDYDLIGLFDSVVPPIHVIGDVSFIPPVVPVVPPLTDNSDREMEIGMRYTFTLLSDDDSFVGTYAGSTSSRMTFNDLLTLPELQPMNQNINIRYDANNRPIRYLQTGMKSHKRRRRRIRKETKSKKRNLIRTKGKSNKKNKRLIN
jgi:hypothetical protein